LARSSKHHARLRRLATKSGEKCGLAQAKLKQDINAGIVAGNVFGIVEKIESVEITADGQ
jgi:hypothetical protein